MERLDDQRERYLSAEEIRGLKQALDEKTHQSDTDTREIKQVFIDSGF